MTGEQKRAWIMVLVAVVAYLVYAGIILGRADGGPLAGVPYAATMLWTIGASILATIVLDIVSSIVLGIALRSGEVGVRDVRDRQIHHFGERVGQSFTVIGAVAGMLLAMAGAQPFWIANAIYLGFTLSAVLASVTKLAAYRWGLPTW